jgi:protein-tyrosine-phosphatase
MRSILVFLASVLSLPALSSCRRPTSAHDARVVFVCEHGAAKSVVAAEHFNRLAAERGLAVRAVARGAEPQDAPSKATAVGLRGEGIDPPIGAPLPLALADLQRAPRVVAFDCDAPTMKALRALGACWNDVPAIADGYAPARDAIHAHAAALVDEMSR